MKRIKIVYFMIIMIILQAVTPFASVKAAGRYNNETNEIAGNASATNAEYSPADAPEINAEAAIVMDLDTGDILYEKSSHKEMYPASITKVLTCLIALEKGNLSDTLTVSDYVSNQVDPRSQVTIGIQNGEQISFKDALYGMMLNSGNMCTLMIAENIAGTKESFADLMNEKAKSLGCSNSHFVEPNGYQDDNQYTSAYDMAIIGRAAYQYPEFKRIISSVSYNVPKTNMNTDRILWQDCKLVYKLNTDYYLPFAMGGKTGYTDTAKGTLISFAEMDSRRLVCVVLKCDPQAEYYNDTRKLYNYCFDRYVKYRPLENFDFNDIDKSDNVMLNNFYNDLNHGRAKYTVDKKYSFYIRSFVDKSAITQDISLYDTPQDKVAGKITFNYLGEQVGETDIIAEMPYVVATTTDASPKKRITPEEETKIQDFIKKVIVGIMICIITLLLLIIIVKINRLLAYRKTKRSVKYFPRTRDMRSPENQKKLKEEAKKSGRNKDDETSGKAKKKKKTELDEHELEILSIKDLTKKDLRNIKKLFDEN